MKMCFNYTTLKQQFLNYTLGARGALFPSRKKKNQPISRALAVCYTNVGKLQTCVQFVDCK